MKVDEVTVEFDNIEMLRRNEYDLLQRKHKGTPKFNHDN